MLAIFSALVNGGSTLTAREGIINNYEDCTSFWYYTTHPQAEFAFVGWQSFDSTRTY